MKTLQAKKTPSYKDLSKTRDYIRLILTNCGKNEMFNVIKIKTDDTKIVVSFQNEDNENIISTAPGTEWLNITYYINDIFAENETFVMEVNENVVEFHFVNAFNASLSSNKTLIIKKKGSYKQAEEEV
jgi:hypothetical protein